MALDSTTTEVDMGSSDSGSTVRATVVQAATVFYDTPATLGLLHFLSFVTSNIMFVYFVCLC